MVILKQIPEDFVVQEISNVIVKESGKYSYYWLKKKERNTLDCVRKLAQQLRIREKDIGFAGSKDKQAVTSQLISLCNISPEKVKRVKNVKLEFFGYGNGPISLGDLVGNHFEIVVRGLDISDTITETDFVENYFDEQRFSVHNVKVGRDLVKKDFKKAVELINDQKLNDHLLKKSNDFIGALKLLPIRLLRLYVNAYQSYLWNETLAQYLKKFNIVRTIKYSLGELVFVDKHLDLEVPLIGFNKDLISAQFKKIINDLVNKENISFTDFVIKQIPELSLEGELRKGFVAVEDLDIGKLEPDELNPGKHKVKLSFTLPKGSYATIVVKRMVQICP